MSPAAVLLAEVRSRGAVAYRLGDRIRLRPATAIPPDLLDRLRAHKTELLQLVPDFDAIYQALTTAFGTTEDLAAIEWHAVLNGGWIIGEIAVLERRCEQLAAVGADETTYRAAVTVLVARMQQIRAWHRAANSNDPAPEAARPQWRLTVDVNHPVPGPIRLDDGTEIVDVGKFIAQTFTAIDYVIQRPPRSNPDGTALMRVYIGQLEHVGVVARVDPVS